VTTWDGQPISPDPPHGAAIVVYRRTPDGLAFLMLHRAHQGPDHEGDWAWGCPSGARHPGEPVDDCAVRELLEESGLTLECVAVDVVGQENWPCYLAEAPAGAEVVLSAEHDRYEWLPLNVAVEMCLPVEIGAGLRRAAELIRS
jgi:8-oxo-dGTP pyrophosphatase MutT (NUDIX family)